MYETCSSKESVPIYTSSYMADIKTQLCIQNLQMSVQKVDYSSCSQYLSQLPLINSLNDIWEKILFNIITFNTHNFTVQQKFPCSIEKEFSVCTVNLEDILKYPIPNPSNCFGVPKAAFCSYVFFSLHYNEAVNKPCKYPHLWS